MIKLFFCSGIWFSATAILPRLRLRKSKDRTPQRGPFSLVGPAGARATKVFRLGATTASRWATGERLVELLCSSGEGRNSRSARSTGRIQADGLWVAPRECCAGTKLQARRDGPFLAASRHLPTSKPDPTKFPEPAPTKGGVWGDESSATSRSSGAFARCDGECAAPAVPPNGRD